MRIAIEELESLLGAARAVLARIDQECRTARRASTKRDLRRAVALERVQSLAAAIEKLKS